MSEDLETYDWYNYFRHWDNYYRSTLIPTPITGKLRGPHGFSCDVSLPPITAKDPSTVTQSHIDLLEKAYLLEMTRTMAKNSYDDARIAALGAAEHGISEVKIARLLNVSRMTVRKWRGK